MATLAVHFFMFYGLLCNFVSRNDVLVNAPCAKTHESKPTVTAMTTPF